MSFRNIIAILLCLAYLLSPPSAYAAEIAESNTIEATRVQELVEYRQKNSDTYLLSNGQLETVFYTENKYYENSAGNLVEIDNSIVPTTHIQRGNAYNFSNKSNDMKAYFKSKGPEIMLSYNGANLFFSCINASSTKVSSSAVLGKSRMSYIFDGFDLQSSNCITYPDAFQSTDLIYKVENDALKEYLVLKDENAPTEFLFSFDTTSLEIQQNCDGSVVVLDEEGTVIFSFASLFAVDAANTYTDALEYDVTARQDGSTIVSVSLDEEYFAAEDRQFPIMIDPSIMVTGSSSTYDTYVSKKYPTTNYYLNEYLRTGYDDAYGVRRSYIKFDLDVNYIIASRMTSAYISIKRSSGSTPAVKAARVIADWSSSTLTWNNQPGYASGGSGVSTLQSNNWYRIDVYDIVKSWLNATYPNYGFMLKDNTENVASQWTTFFASDAPSPNKPELHIVYTYYGPRHYSQNDSTNVNCMGFALDVDQFISKDTLGISEAAMNGMNKSQMEAYIAGKAEAWMATNIGSANFNRISSYNSNFNFGWYRIVLRVGFVDADGDNIFDSGERFDYHWRFQTADGNWAEKQGHAPSQLLSNTVNTNPTAAAWVCSGLTYDSPGVYYQINGRRNS